MTAGTTPAIDEARDLLKQARKELADNLPGSATLLAQRALVHATIAAAGLAARKRIALTQVVVDHIAAAGAAQDDAGIGILEPAPEPEPEPEPAHFAGHKCATLSDATLIARRGCLATDSPDDYAHNVARLVLHRDQPWPGNYLIARRALNTARDRHERDDVRAAALFLGIQL